MVVVAAWAWAKPAAPVWFDGGGGGGERMTSG
jgi:hypothetical protein